MVDISSLLTRMAEAEAHGCKFTIFYVHGGFHRTVVTREGDDMRHVGIGNSMLDSIADVLGRLDREKALRCELRSSQYV